MLRDRLAIAACVAAGLLALALALRTQGTTDLGYHLAYGDHLGSTGAIVDDAYLIHPPTENAGELPGAWVDPSGGRYHFVNANWLSQAIMSGVYAIAGGVGLTLLQVLLVGVVLAGLGATVRHADRSWGAVALVWLIFTAIGYERFSLRPELFSYACLAGQVALLTSRPRWVNLLGVLTIQLMLVNLHSFWPLGVGLAVLFAFRGWKHVVLAPLTFAIAIVHPFGWRNVVFPFQTSAYLSEHAITGAARVSPMDVLSGAAHPWASIGELRWTFADPWAAVATAAFAIALLLVIPGVILLVARRGDRRWLWIAPLVLFAALGCQMRRNLGPAALIVAPALAIAFTTAAHAAPRARLVAFTPILTIILAAAGIVATVTNVWYEREGAPWRFGAGLDRAGLHLDAAAALDEHLPEAQPVFTDFDHSSNLVYFSDRMTAAPLLTNTWAMTPGRMRQVTAMTLNAGEVEGQLARWGYAAAMIPDGRMADRLRERANWRLVHRTDAGLCLFRRIDPGTAIAAQRPIDR